MTTETAEYFDKVFVKIAKTLTYFELKQLEKIIAEELEERGE